MTDSIRLNPDVLLSNAQALEGDLWALWVDHAGEPYALLEDGSIFGWNHGAPYPLTSVSRDYVRQWFASYRIAERDGSPVIAELVYESPLLAQAAPEAYPAAVITIETGEPQAAVLDPFGESLGPATYRRIRGVEEEAWTGEGYPAPEDLHRSTYPLAPPRG